jgi:membrane-bound lytic murein transglycosylase A
VPTGDLVEVPPDRLPDVADDLDAESLIAAVDQDLRYLSGRSAARFRVAGDVCDVAEVQSALEEVREAARSGVLVDVVRRRFRFYRSGGRRGGPLITGYYEPILDGRRERSSGFESPIYRMPDDLVEVDLGDFLPELFGRKIHGRLQEGRLVPYFTRREIDGDGVLGGRGLELAWLADPVAAFFLQVQGSGRIRLADGTMVRVGFAAANGRRYTSIGRTLLDEGAIAGGEASAPGIQRYLRAHPERSSAVLFRNPRYVFFREVPRGPVGSLGVELTPGRSVAADASFYAPGSLLYVKTGTPDLDARGEFAGTRPARRLVLVQDAGAAITGPGRLDLFFGSGDRAGLEAGTMSYGGEIYVLLPRCADAP